MAPKGWTKGEQGPWLKERVPACVEARRHNRFGTWVATVHHDWFLRWPERRERFEWEGPLTPEQLKELGDAIEKRRQQIINWFNNHKNRNRDAQTLPASITAAIAQPNGPRRRCPQAREVYCRLYYNAEKRSIVKSLLTQERQRLGRKLSNKERLAISRGRIDAWYAAEPEHVKAAVLAKLEEETNEIKNAPPPEPRDLSARTPQEYQNAIDRAPGVIERLVQPVADDCGWVICVIAAGPCPDQGGEIRSFSCHFGENTFGQSLGEALEDYKDKFIRPIRSFAKSAFSREVRQSRALASIVSDSESDDEDEDEDEGGPGPSGSKKSRRTPAIAPSTSATGTLPSSSSSVATVQPIPAAIPPVPTTAITAALPAPPAPSAPAPPAPSALDPLDPLAPPASSALDLLSTAAAAIADSERSIDGASTTFNFPVETPFTYDGNTADTWHRSQPRSHTDLGTGGDPYDPLNYEEPPVFQPPLPTSFLASLTMPLTEEERTHGMDIDAPTYSATDAYVANSPYPSMSVASSMLPTAPAGAVPSFVPSALPPAPSVVPPPFPPPPPVPPPRLPIPPAAAPPVLTVTLPVAPPAAIPMPAVEDEEGEDEGDDEDEGEDEDEELPDASEEAAETGRGRRVRKAPLNADGTSRKGVAAAKRKDTSKGNAAKPKGKAATPKTAPKGKAAKPMATKASKRKADAAPDGETATKRRPAARKTRAR